MPLALDQGLGTVVWSPLGWARLTGKIRRGTPLPESSRLKHQHLADAGPQIPEEYLYRVVDALDDLAKETGKTVPQIALLQLALPKAPPLPASSSARVTKNNLKQNLGSLGWNPSPSPPKSPNSMPPAKSPSPIPIGINAISSASATPRPSNLFL